MGTNEFRYYEDYRNAPMQSIFSQGTPYVDPTAFGNEGLDPDLQSPDIYQYNLTLERELGGDMGVRASYIGSTMRKLLTNIDYNRLRPSTEFFDNGDAASYERLPYAPYGTWLNIVENQGEGQLHAFQLQLTRRWRAGLAFDVAYTYAHSDMQRARLGQQHAGGEPLRPVEHRQRARPRARPERGEAPRRRERDLGHPGRQEPQARLEHAGLGGRPLRRLDGLHDLPGAERPQPDPVLQRVLLLQPLEHGHLHGRRRQHRLLRVAPQPGR